MAYKGIERGNRPQSQAANLTGKKVFVIDDPIFADRLENDLRNAGAEVIRSATRIGEGLTPDAIKPISEEIERHKPDAIVIHMPGMGRISGGFGGAIIPINEEPTFRIATAANALNIPVLVLDIEKPQQEQLSEMQKIGVRFHSAFDKIGQESTIVAEIIKSEIGSQKRRPV